MPMEIDAKEKTALLPSVCADERQSIHNDSEDSIPTSVPEINEECENSPENLEEMYRRIQRMTDPHYLHTRSMIELY